MYSELPKPTIFAHRGASAFAPENTIAAFEMAIQQNADAIELDAKLSKDGKIVVIHDSTVDRTTDGYGKVAALTLKNLKELNAGKRFGDTFTGESIPTLSEVFEAVGNKIFINVELTNYETPWDLLPEKTAELINYHGLNHRILLSSFNPIALLKIHSALPKIPLGLLSTPGISGAWARSFLGRWIPYKAIHPEYRDTNRKMIMKFQRNGLRVHSYTVNNRDDMVRLFTWKIDGIFTDDVPLAKRTINKLAKN